MVGGVASNKRRKNTTLMLLGPYKLLDFRARVKKELQYMGYNVIIMEKKLRKQTDSTLDEKFERIIEKHEPVIFIAFFHKKEKNVHGVSFEIGFISGRYGANNIGDKLTFLGDKGYSWDVHNSSAYIKSSVSKIITSNFDERKKYSKASTKIDNFVRHLKNLLDTDIQKPSQSV